MPKFEDLPIPEDIGDYCDMLEEKLKELEVAKQFWEEEHEQAKKWIARLEEALRFYADAKDIESDYDGCVLEWCGPEIGYKPLGQKAREALADEGDAGAMEVWLRE
jgi:HPt (histidine-containing phosphotransfer) domain-containing protein